MYTYTLKGTLIYYLFYSFYCIQQIKIIHLFIKILNFAENILLMTQFNCKKPIDFNLTNQYFVDILMKYFLMIISYYRKI
jgi:hypothetical protein